MDYAQVFDEGHLANSKSTPESKRSAHRVLTLLVFTGTVVLYSGVTQYGQRWGVPPFAWLIPMLVLAFLSLLTSNYLHLRTSPLVVWVYTNITIASIWAFLNPDISRAFASLTDTLLFMSVLLTFYYLLSLDGALYAAALGVFTSVTVMVALNTYEYFEPGTFSTVTGRSAGMHLNPNTAGFALVLGMLLANRIVPSRLRTIFHLFAGVGVFLTFSRGALLCWVIAFIFLQFSELRRPSQSLFSWMLVGFAVVLAFSPQFSWDAPETEASREHLNSQLLERLNILDAEATLDDSRVVLANRALESFLDHFWIGTGTGTALFEYEGIPTATHNLFLTLGVEFGILGIALIISLFYMLTSARSVRWFTVPTVMVIFVACFFSHLIFAQWHYAVVFAILARVNTLGPRDIWTRHKPIQPNVAGTHAIK